MTMAVNLSPLTTFYPVNGIKIGTVCAQIKQTQHDDLTLFVIAENSTCAAVFTRNAFCAAPVIIARQHLFASAPRALLINSGNANAGTGQQGLQNARTCCDTVAKLLNCASTQVLPFSTGVIGQSLPVDKICGVVATALATANTENWENAAQAIMTTDTIPKAVSIQKIIADELITITGIAKGSGMIKPDMATMLSFIATDVQISQSLLQICLERAVNVSFNRITVDSDTSTNDACVLVATGKSGLHIDSVDHPAFADFCQAVTQVCTQLAQAIIRDGEGATKFITITVEQGSSEQECIDVAYTIAHSPLVKTAFFASDANWGRILAAVGRAPVDNLVIEAIKINLDDVCIVEQGGVAASYTEEQGRRIMQQNEITIRVNLGRGTQHATVWTCDFSYDYVKINAEYRT